MTTIQPSFTPTERTAAVGRVHSIQYLRAVAALAVVLLHAGSRVETHLPAPLAQSLHLGHAGVDLFFVISGFIMWTIGRDAPSTPGQFLLRRAIRVAPPYWIATICWVLLMWVLGVRWISLAPDHVLRSLLFVPHWSPTFPEKFWPVLVPGWTLIFEMFFYAVFALTLLVAGAGRLIFLIGLLMALVGLGLVLNPTSAVLVAYTSPLLLEFLGGCLVAEIWRRWPDAARAHWGVLLIAAGLGLLFWLGPGVTADQTAWNRPAIFGTAGVLVVWGVVWLEDRLPYLPWLERLGDASYAIYLFHLFIVTALIQFWHQVPAIHGPVGALIFLGLCMALASALGIWIFKWIEYPLQKYLNKVFLKRKQRG